MTQPALAFYADDFTGACDVMDVAARFGHRPSIYLSAIQIKTDPDPGDVVGVAGLSRSMTTNDLLVEVGTQLSDLLALNPRTLQYKVCSTFDSAPDRGNIAAALRCGQELTGQSVVPVVVGMPAMGRYVCFGNLFAATAGESTPYRLDRHPVMAQHPATPMHEADLALHLQHLGRIRTQVVDMVILKAGEQPVLETEVEALLYDTLDETDLTTIGHQLAARTPHNGTMYCVGSSGASWAALAGQGYTAGTPEPRQLPRRQTVVLSGSRSAVTDRQIAYAAEHGFRVHVLAVDDPQPTHTLSAAAGDVRAGHSIIVRTGAHTHRADPRAISELLAAAGQALADQALTDPALADPALGDQDPADQRSAAHVRWVICGGDTSGEVGTAFGITRIAYDTPLDTAAPFTSVTSEDARFDGASFVFKGGQVGQLDLLVAAERGGRPPNGASGGCVGQ